MTAAIDPYVLAGQIRIKARELGFDLVGITSATPSPRKEFFRQWLDAGKAGSMAYLAKRFDERVDPSVYFPGVKSVICVAKNYYTPLEQNASPTAGKIARYALGDDYHEWIKDRLFLLADWLRQQVPGIETKCGVDTAPILEREIAARAGIGWVGKNTLVIHPQMGSWMFLGEVLCTLELPIDDAAVDRCGTCTRCIDACPTQAITPYEVNGARCISYLTIEHREAIPAEFEKPIGDWLYGCDICQDVCPFNRKAPTTVEPAFQPRFASGSLDVQDVMNWQPTDYQKQFRNSAVRRVKLPILQRNAAIVRSNKS